jgi:adenylate kinase family enzyme
MTAHTTAIPARDAAPGAPRRVVVGGTTGSGKTTAAGRIAAIAGAPHIELDALHWEPDWTPAELHTFRARVSAATEGPCWVVDGGYRQVRDLTWGRADTFLWLDYAYPRVLAQLTRRVLHRIFTKEVLWNGNRETIRNTFFSKESLFVWQVNTHWQKRRNYPQALREPAYQHLRVVRVWHPDDLERWLTYLRRAYAP